MQRNTRGQFVKGCVAWNKGIKGRANSGSFKKGQKKSAAWYESMHKRVPWNKGKSGTYKLRPHTEETKRKIRQSNLGQKRSLKTRLKLRKYTGSKNSQWKGGVNDINDNIRHSAELKDWRRKVYERDNYKCRAKGKHKGMLNAHHIKSFSKYPELRFVVSNGITLCEKHHKKVREK